MQNRRRPEQRARARLGQRAEQERADRQRDDGREHADLDAPHRVDDVPAAAEDRPDAVADALEERRRSPRDEGGLAVVPGLDQALAGSGNVERRPGLDDVVLEVAGTRQPDAPVQDLEAAAAGAERHDGAATQGFDAVLGGHQAAPDILHMHHGSPSLTVPL